MAKNCDNILSVEVKNGCLHFLDTEDVERDLHTRKRASSEPPKGKTDGPPEALTAVCERLMEWQFRCNQTQPVNIETSAQDRRKASGDAKRLTPESFMSQSTSASFQSEGSADVESDEDISNSSTERLQSASAYEKHVAKQQEQACKKLKLLLKQQEELAGLVKDQHEATIKLQDQRGKAEAEVCKLTSQSVKETHPRRGLPSETECNNQVLALMMKNIPCRCTSEEVLDAIDSLGFGHRCNFFYLPIMTSKQNKGYAFISFPTLSCVEEFIAAAQGFSFAQRKSTKVVEIVPARIQGLQDCVDHFEETRMGNCKGSPFLVRTSEQTVERM